MSISEDDCDQFAVLFPSNKRSYGQYNPKLEGKEKKPANTVKGQFYGETNAIRAHLEGEVGLGLVPIHDSHKCQWAALDFDVHGPNGKPIDIEFIEAEVRRFDLPLTVCRSKSGGAHLYLFLREATLCSMVTVIMRRWAVKLKFPTCEIFPKQVRIEREDNPNEGWEGKSLGSWLNMPYFRAHSTERYCLHMGHQLSLSEFIQLAEAKRYSITERDRRGDEDFERGPPCIQRMMENPIEEGNRNLAVFQAGVFLKRAFPTEFRVKMEAFNKAGLTVALDKQELKTVMGSVGRRDYHYKCREEPCKSLCDKDLCRTREFGITPEDVRVNELPPIQKVEKIIATPVRWAITIEGQIVEVTSEQLFDFNRVRIAIGEKTHRIIPRMKSDDWDMYLRQMMEKVEIRKEVTMEDVIFGHLCDFLKRANSDKTREEDERRSDLLRRMPCLLSITNTQYKPANQQGEEGGLEENGAKWYYAFKAVDFIAYLRRNRALILAEPAIHTAVTKILGTEAKRDRVRVTEYGDIRRVWFVAEDDVQNEVIPTTIFHPEY